jgi:hypothetical protein
MWTTKAVPAGRVDNALLRRIDRFFYLGMALLNAAIVIWGFGPTVSPNLLHRPVPAPRVLFLHAALFAGFVVLLIVQAALIVSRRVAWHRRLGLVGAWLGVCVVVVGTTTALSMTGLHNAQGFLNDSRFLIAPLFDMLAFSVTFGLGIYWRRRPEFHRRLIWMAFCILSVAAFSRLPNWLIPYNGWYAGVDVLILSAATRDWVVMRSVHPVYLYGFPMLLCGQVTTLWIYLHGWAPWSRITQWMLT